MDHRKQATIVDAVTALYTRIRSTLGMPRGDDRVAELDQVTEAFLEQVLALEDREPADRPSLQLVDGLG